MTANWTTAHERDMIANTVFSVLSKNECHDLIEVIASKLVGNVHSDAVKRLMGLSLHGQAADIVLASVAAKFPRTDAAQA